MADEALSNAGLHFDELNKVRVLEPEINSQTTELKEECKEFVESRLHITTVAYRPKLILNCSVTSLVLTYILYHKVKLQSTRNT